MEKPKGSPKAKIKRGDSQFPDDWLRFDVPFAFVSPLPFEDCVARLYHIESQSTFYLRYTVQVLPIQNVYDDRICEFRVKMGGTGIEAVGFLRALGDETITHVEGRVGVKLLKYLRIGLMLALFALGFMSVIYPVSNVWGAPVLCFILGFLILATIVWLVDMSQRSQMLRLIQAALETRRRKIA